MMRRGTGCTIQKGAQSALCQAGWLHKVGTEEMEELFT